MDNDNLTTSFWHWVAPILSAIVSILAVGAVIFTAGGQSQRITTTEQRVEKMDADNIKRSEVEYRLKSIEQTVNEIRQDQKELNKRPAR